MSDDQDSPVLLAWRGRKHNFPGHPADIELLPRDSHEPLDCDGHGHQGRANPTTCDGHGYAAYK